jgi:hypothetical protein
MTQLPPSSFPSLTSEDLQRIFNVSERTVTNWVANRMVRYFRKGRVLRFAPDAVLEFIARNSVNARSGSIHVADSVVINQVRLLLSICGVPDADVQKSEGTRDHGSAEALRPNFNTTGTE